MTADEFERAIRNGLGRVILYLQTHDSTSYRDIILHACLHNSAIDPQAEGTRSEYLFDIINLTKEKDFYRDAILATLVEATDDDSWQLEHLFYLAGEFAKAGDDVARQAMFAKVDVEVANTFWVGLSLIETFRVEGFLFLIDLLGQEVLETGEFHDGDYYLRTLEEREPSISASEIKVACDAARAINPRIEAYLAGIERYRRKARPKKRRNRFVDDLKNMDYGGVRETVENHIAKPDTEYPLRSLQHWGTHVSQEQLYMAAEDFLREEDELKLASYVWIFWKTPFPLDLGKLIRLAEHKDRGLAIGSIMVLEHFSDLAVRELAFRMIQDEIWLEAAAGLLRKNFQEGDWVLLEGLTARNLAAEVYHGMGFDVERIFEEHRDLDGVPALLNLYENGACSVCRERIVELLYEAGQLPEEIREECQYDANIDLRKWVQEAFK